MSQADVELIRGLYDAWLAGDRDAAIEGTDPGIEWVQAPDALESEVRRGYQGVEYSMAQWTAAFDDFGFEIRELRDLGPGRVLACLLQHGRPHGSAVAVEGTLFQLWTVRDGRAVRAEMFRLEAEALEAASRPAEPA